MLQDAGRGRLRGRALVDLPVRVVVQEALVALGPVRRQARVQQRLLDGVVPDADLHDLAGLVGGRDLAGVDQFITKDPVTANERWGWLSHEDVVSFGFKQNTDSKLKFDASRRNDAGYTIPDILDFEGLSPSAQRALEVLGAFFPDFKPSIPSLLEILDFAVKRQLNPLINEVIGLFKGIDSWEEYETFSECVCQYLDDPSFTEALKALNEPLILGDDFTEVQKTQIAVFNDALSKPLKNRTRGNQSASADANMIAVDRGASRFSI